MKTLAVVLAVLMSVGIVAGLVAAADDAAAPAQTQTQAQTPTTQTAPWANATDKQKAELQALADQMYALRIREIDKYLEYGWISKAQAEVMKERLDLQKKEAALNGGVPGLGGLGGGCGMGRHGGRGGGMGGMMRGWNGSQAPATNGTSSTTNTSYNA